MYAAKKAGTWDRESQLRQLQAREDLLVRSYIAWAARYLRASRQAKAMSVTFNRMVERAARRLAPGASVDDSPEVRSAQAALRAVEARGSAAEDMCQAIESAMWEVRAGLWASGSSTPGRSYRHMYGDRAMPLYRFGPPTPLGISEPEWLADLMDEPTIRLPPDPPHPTQWEGLLHQLVRVAERGSDYYAARDEPDPDELATPVDRDRDAEPEDRYDTSGNLIEPGTDTWERAGRDENDDEDELQEDIEDDDDDDELDEAV